jgi:hypothetical protein
MPNPENLVGHTFRDKPERINRAGRPKGAVVYVKDLAMLAAKELAKPGKDKETVAADIIHMLIHKKILLKEDIAAMKVLMELLTHMDNQVAEKGKMIIEWGSQNGHSDTDKTA